MAKIVWPLELPREPIESPWQAQQPSARWSFKGDEGPAMTRPKGAAGRKLSMDFLMTLEQWRIFKRFWGQGLNKGVLPFDYQDPDSGDLLEVRFDPDSEMDFTAKGNGPFRRSVSMVWEILP